MQEDIENRAVALIINAQRLTRQNLTRACSALLRKMGHKRQAKKNAKPKRETVKDLMKRKDAQSVPFSGDTHQFEYFARKHNVDFEYKRLGKSKFLVCFKSGHEDNIKNCLAAYTEYEKNREEKRSIKKDIKQGKAQARAAAKTERALTRTKGKAEVGHDR